MMKTSSVLTAVTVLALATLSGAAFADGVKAEPKPVISPLDKAVNDIQKMQPPAMQAEEAPAAAEKKIEADEPLPKPAEAEAQPAPVAPENRTVEVQSSNPAFLGLSIGVFDPLRESERSLALNAEYQPGMKIAGFLQPLFGATVTSGTAVMGYAGLGVPFNVTEKVMITPSLALAAYHNGADYDLGKMINLRLGGEIAYVMPNKSRIGLGGYVLSNMDSLQKRDRTGMIMVTYSTPTNLLSGK